MSRALLASAVERHTLSDHDGRSGAGIERIRLADGTRLVLKRSAPASDLTLQLTGNVDRERALWEHGTLDRLPPTVSHAIIDIWDEDGTTCTLMRDVGEYVPGWTRVLDHHECSRIVDAMTALHATFVDDVPDALCPLSTRLSLLSPRSVVSHRDAGNPLVGAVLDGWQRFAEIVDADLTAAVFAVHDDPTALAAAMSDGPITLLHADLWLVNLALTPDAVVLLDWAIATAGPPAFDLTVFLTGAAAHVVPSREDLIAEFMERRTLCSERSMRLALLASLVDLGWNKALDATSHDDASIRARERADLDWWCNQAQLTLERYPL